MRKHLNNQKGFTLIELLIALSLLVVVCFMLFSFYEYGTRIFHKESDEIVVRTELRNATEMILTECRKANNYSTGNNSLIFSDHSTTLVKENNNLYLVETDNSTGEETKIYLAGNIKDFTFSIKAREVEIAIYSNHCDLNGNNIEIKSTYQIRLNYG